MTAGSGTQDMGLELVSGANTRSLRLCSLDDNLIGEKGAAELAKVLPECKSLVSFR